MTVPFVRLVVLNYNGGDHVMKCMEHLHALDWPADRREIVVVDNHSSDDSPDSIAAAFPSVELVRLGRNLGFPGNNVALRDEGEFEFAALVNNDAFVHPGWLDALVDAALEDRSIGAACSKVVFGGESEQRAGVQIINNAGSIVFEDGYGADRGFDEPDTGQYDEATDVFAWCGNGVLLRRAYLADVGLFDPELFLYYEDTDLSWRGQARGWRYRYVPDAVVEHLHARSSGVGSELFRYYNERNRLVCLVKNAPASLVARQAVRFLVSTASYAVHGDRATARDRLVAYGGFLRLVPYALGRRRHIRSRRLVGDRELLAGLRPRR